MTRKMKDSGIEWIGEIPEEWNLVKGKYLFKLRTTKGNTKNVQLLSPTQNFGVIPQELYEKLTGMRPVKLKSDADLQQMRTIYKGDYCISLRSFQGGFEYSKYDGVVSPAYQVFYPYKKINSTYYRYLFKNSSFIQKINSFTMSLRDGKNIAFSDFGNIDIPFPTFVEQNKIAKFLDKKISEIHQTFQAIQQEIDALEEYRKSLITETVTKGLDKNVPMKDSGIEWIGEIPENWEPIKLKFLSDKIDRGTPPNYTKEHITKVVNQATFSKGFFDKSDIRFSSINANQSRGLLKKKDILIASTGGGVLGKTLYYQENDTYVADSHVTIMRINSEKYNSKLIYYLLLVNYELINGTMAQGSTNQIELQKNLLANFYVPYIPDEKERKRIVEFLDNNSNLINRIIENKKEQLKILTKYKQSIIYEYVTGKKQVPEKEGVKNAQ